MKSKDKRFITVYKQGGLESKEIFVDKETGVNYIFAESGYAGGLTALLKPDGTPVITPASELADNE